MKFKVYKSSAALEMSTWEYKLEPQADGSIKKTPVFKAVMEIAPSNGTCKGQPKPGSKCYDYTKKCKISFNPMDMLIVSYKLQAMAAEVKEDYTKFGDMSKVANSESTDKKKLTISLGDTGGVNFYLSDGAKKVNITMDKVEAYALSRWFDCTYNKFYNMSESNFTEAID